MDYKLVDERIQSMMKTIKAIKEGMEMEYVSPELYTTLYNAMLEQMEVDEKPNDELEMLESLFDMKFEHVYAEGQLSFIKETLQNGEISYWINADEITKKTNEGKCIAVKFTDNQLIELREVLNKLELKESK